MVTMAFPYALETIEWQTYMINGAWDAVQVIYVAIYWVETKGKTLEEIDVLFDKVKHSDGPDVQAVVNSGAKSNLILNGVEVATSEQIEGTITPSSVAK